MEVMCEMQSIECRTLNGKGVRHSLFTTRYSRNS